VFFRAIAMLRVRQLYTAGMRHLVAIVIGAAMLALVAGGCAETPQQKAQQLEPLLSAAGFHMHPADTPARENALKALTPYTMRYYVKNGQLHYWYADPAGCNCVYVGREKNYQQFQKLRLEERMASEQARAAQLNEETVQQEQMDLSLWPYDPMW
jgi:hypothetical protein